MGEQLPFSRALRFRCLCRRRRRRSNITSLFIVLRCVSDIVIKDDDRRTVSWKRRQR